MTGWCRRCSRMMTDTRPHPRCSVCGLLLTPEAQVDIDAPSLAQAPSHASSSTALGPLAPWAPWASLGPGLGRVPASLTRANNAPGAMTL